MQSDVYLRPVPDGLRNDVWLRPFGPDAAAFEARDDKPGRSRGKQLIRRLPPMPVDARSLFHSLLRRYGPVNGQRVYWGMYDERKGPFAAGAKYDPDKEDPDA